VIKCEYHMYRLLLFFSLLFIIGGCIDQPASERIANMPPQTFVWLMPDDTVRTTSSRQHIHWWGDDPDGFVVGYEWSFNRTDWNRTERNDSVFLLSLQQEDTTYSFYVRAIDNEGAHDPDPASLSIPIKNTPPSVEFVDGTTVPRTTFTVATFAWSGTDPDGDDTIIRYLWALNDTTEWNELSGASSMLTVRTGDGLRVNDNNIFYLKAQDNAGAYSKTAIMPNDPAPDNPERPPDTTAYWFVREPIGDLLIVDDYDLDDRPDTMYTAIFDTLGGGIFRDHSVWDIRQGRTETQRGDLVPPFINPTVVETLRLFRYIYWYSDNGPSYNVAQSAIPRYLETGGKVLMSVTFPTGVFDPREQGLVDFAPVDSIAERDIGFVRPRARIIPTDQAEGLGYPELIRDPVGFGIGGVRNLIGQTGAIPLYHVDHAENPLVAVKTPDNNMIFFGLRLHRMNGDPADPDSQRLGKLFYKIFIDEFGN
jgi:hypothetical protein